MNLANMPDASLGDEIEKQRAVMKKHPEGHAFWITAARILHHLEKERARRYRVKAAGITEEQPT